MEEYILLPRWVGRRSPPVVTCSQTHPKWHLLFQSYIPSSPICASRGHLPVLLTFKSLFQCLILEDPNQGKEIKGLAVYHWFTFRLISHPSSHWTPCLPFVITSHTPRLSCHPSAHPCSLPGNPGLFIWHSETSVTCLDVTLCLSPAPLQPHTGEHVFQPPCCFPSCQNALQWSHILAFTQMFSSVPNGTWEFCLHFWSTFIHVAERVVSSCRPYSPCSDLQVKTRALVYAPVFLLTFVSVWQHTDTGPVKSRALHGARGVQWEQMRESPARWPCKNSAHSVTKLSVLLTQAYVCRILLTGNLALIFWASYWEGRKKPP